MEKNKKLYRSQKNKIIGGVAAGLAEYFEIDSVIIRVFFVLLAVAGGGFPMVIAYLILMIVIPKEGHQKDEVGEKVKEAGEEIKEAAQEIAGQVKEQVVEAQRGRGWFSSPRHWIGLVLILVGGSMIWNVFSPYYFHIGGRFMLPAIILVFGFFLILSGSENRK